MKKIYGATLAAATLILAGCTSVEPQTLDKEETGYFTMSTEDAIESRVVYTSGNSAVLPKKLTELDTQTRYELKKHRRLMDQYNEIKKDRGDFEAYVNALESLVAIKMSTPFDKACIQRGMELFETNQPPQHVFVPVPTNHINNAKKRPSEEKSKLILLYAERRALYYNRLDHFNALGCDINAVREIPFFAILEFELLGLEEKYKNIDNSDTKN